MQPASDWYLAKEPGPGVASDPSQVPYGRTVSSRPLNGWADTGKGH